MDRWLQIAYRHDGHDEDENVEELQSLFRTAGFEWDPRGDHNAWCGAFVRACLVIAGCPDPGPEGLRAASYATYGEECEPKPGAIVVGRNHVAFLVEGNKIIGGNQGDKVKEGQVDWYFSNPVYRYPVMPKPVETPIDIADFSDEEIRAEYARRFPEAANAETSSDADGNDSDKTPELPEGKISANALATALMDQVVVPHGCREKVMVPETGEMVKVQPFRLTDKEYRLPTRVEVEDAIKETKVDEINYVAEEWDCEDFARRFVSKMHEKGIQTAGRVMAWSGNHSFNIVAIQGDPVEFIFVEPQTDQIVALFSEDKYNIDDVLIIIS